jgi:2,4-diaminopentanoate dehydrogenase
MRGSFMPASPTFSPRLAIYGIGFVGQELVRLATKKGWLIVAAFNRAGDKVGQDIGRLAGLDRDLGVIVQDSETGKYSGLNVDIALITAQELLEENWPAYERFLGAGINVLCHGSASYNPWWSNPEIAGKIDTLAKQHGVTFSGGGIWDSTRIWSGLVAAGPCVEIESILHRTQTEVARQGKYWLDRLGVGLTDEAYREKYSAGVGGGVFAIPSVSVLQKIGYTITDVVQSQAPVIWNESYFCPVLDKPLAAGISWGTRFLGDVATREGVTARSEIEARAFREGEVEELRWTIKGMPGMDVRVVRENSGVASASSLLNRIPDIIAAEPGIVETTKHAPLKSSALL